MTGRRDSRGRRRVVGQERGLRPLHPALPPRWVSRAIRVAMSEGDWARLEAVVRRYARDETTGARSYGLAIAHLMDKASAERAGALDWLDWERRKTLRLLAEGRSRSAS